MDESPTQTPSAAAKLQAQVESITDQLIQLCLLEVSKKYNLPALQLDFPSVSQSVDRAIRTGLYTVTITCDVHQAHVKWKLNMPAIKGRIAEIQKPDFISGLFKRVIGKNGESQACATSWSFCGFISENPISIESVKGAEEIETKAPISSKVDGQLSFRLTPGIPQSALFFVMFDHETKFVIEEDIRTMIQLPLMPSLGEIGILKNQLQELIGKTSMKQESPVSKSEFIRTEILNALQDKVAFKRKLEKLGCSEEDIDAALEDFQFFMTEFLQTTIGDKK